MSYNTNLQENNAALQNILEQVNELPEFDGLDLGITGATVGQTAIITAVDDNGVPTAWEPVDFPSGGGGAKYKFLASAEPITDPVSEIEVSIEEDGITEILLVGKVQQAEANSYSYAFIAINSKSASYNTAITEKNDCWMHYHGVLLEGGYCLFDMRIHQWGDGDLNHALKTPQSGFDGFGEQVKTVSLRHPGGANFATGTYFDVWGR